MNLPGFTAEASLAERNDSSRVVSPEVFARSGLSHAEVIPALAIKELPYEEARACYHNCRNAGLRHDVCAHSCL